MTNSVAHPNFPKTDAFPLSQNISTPIEPKVFRYHVLKIPPIGCVQLYLNLASILLSYNPFQCCSNAYTLPPNSLFSSGIYN